MGSGLQAMKDFGNVSRLEYLPAEAPALFIPLLLGTTTVAGLLNLLWLEAVIVFSLLYTSGFIINSYQDIEVDARWKTRVSGAAQRMGKKKLLRMFIFQMTLALVLSAHLSYMLNTWFIFTITAIGAFFGTAYSLPPLHFKVKGIWHMISLCLSAFAIPFLFFFYIVMGELTVPVIVLLIGFTVAHYGIALANQTADYLEDKAEGLTTPAVKWGLDNTLRTAKAMTMTGLIILLMGLYGLIVEAPWLAGLEVSLAFLPFPGRYLLMGLITALLMLGYSVPTRGLYSIHHISTSKAPIGKRMDRIKDRLNYPRWQASGIWSLAIVSLMIFAMGIYF